MTVTRTCRDGRYVYSINGTLVGTKAKAYDFAVVGTGNPHDPSGYFLGLRSSAAAADREARKHNLQSVKVIAS